MFGDVLLGAPEFRGKLTDPRLTSPEPVDDSKPHRVPQQLEPASDDLCKISGKGRRHCHRDMKHTTHRLCSFPILSRWPLSAPIGGDGSQRKGAARRPPLFELL